MNQGASLTYSTHILLYNSSVHVQWAVGTGDPHKHHKYTRLHHNLTSLWKDNVVDQTLFGVFFHGPLLCVLYLAFSAMVHCVAWSTWRFKFAPKNLHEFIMARLYHINRLHNAPIFFTYNGSPYPYSVSKVHRKQVNT